MPARKAAQLRATAIHEAGHAVMAWHFGIRTKEVTIISDDNSLGRHHREPYITGVSLETYSDASDGRTRLRAERLVLISLAGGAAERRYAPTTWKAHYDLNDRRVAQLLLERLASSERHRFAWFKALAINAADMVERPIFRAGIFGLADALMRQPTLNGENVAAAIRAGINADMDRLTDQI